MSDFELRQATADEGYNRTAILTVIGEVDLGSAPILRDALTQCFTGAQRIVIDARQVTFLDMTGAGLLAAAAHRAAHEKRRFILMPSPRVRQVLALIDLDVDHALPFDAPDGRYVSTMCRLGHHEDCISRPVVSCACPCHP